MPEIELADAPAAALAWLSTLVATGDDKETPTLFRSTLIEGFDGRGVRFVCTTGTMLLRSWASADPWSDDLEPGLDEVPDWGCVVLDRDRRGRDLLRYARAVDDDERPDDPVLRLATFTGREGMLEVERLRVELELPDGATEHVDLDLWEPDSWPRWRNVIPPIGDAAPIPGFDLWPDAVHRLSALGKLHGPGHRLRFQTFEPPGELSGARLAFYVASPDAITTGVFSAARPDE